MEERSSTEKITINVTPVDLGQVDALVAQGLYTNRADFIRTAMRRLLQEQHTVVQEMTTRNSFSVGVQHVGRTQLEKLRARNSRLNLRVLGLVVIGADVSPDLADATVDGITVLGVLRAPRNVVSRLGSRVTVGGRRGSSGEG